MQLHRGDEWMYESLNSTLLSALPLTHNPNHKHVWWISACRSQPIIPPSDLLTWPLANPFLCIRVLAALLSKMILLDEDFLLSDKDMLRYNFIMHDRHMRTNTETSPASPAPSPSPLPLLLIMPMAALSSASSSRLRL